MVDPHDIREALQHLLQCPLYQQYGASMDDTQWQQLLSAVQPPDAGCEGDDVSPHELPSTEREEEIGTDSLSENHLTTAIIHNEALAIAPAEDNRPLYILCDEHAEELAYPKLFCGRARPRLAARISYHDIVKYELRHKQRRFAECISNAFFKYRKLQYLKINSSASIQVRMGRVQDNLMVADALDTTRLEELEKQDECYRSLEKLQNSPDYKHKMKLDLFGMIRQLGTPTWFLTFTANDLNWPELIQALALLATGTHLTPQDAINMSFAEKAQLIREDPVACARMYKRRMQKILQLLKSNPDIIGKVVAYGGADETQGRGTFHSHLQFFLRRSTKFDDPIAVLAELRGLCDLYVSCDASILPPHLQGVQRHECHEHSTATRRACLIKQNGSLVCHFGFPRPPMDQHCVLCPFTAAEQDQYERYKPLYATIKARLGTVDVGKLPDQAALLQDIGNTHLEYIQAIRTSIERDTFFFRRTHGQAWINQFPSRLEPIWNAHMDIQVVLDPYAAANLHHLLHHEREPWHDKHA